MKTRIKQGLIACGAVGLITSVGALTTQMDLVKACQTLNLNQLPSKYDPRPWAIPVRNQHAPNGDSQNLCWSYSGNDMLTFAKQKAFGITSLYSPTYTDKATAVDGLWDYPDLNQLKNLERLVNGGGHIAAASILGILGHNPVLESDLPSTDADGIATGAIARNRLLADEFEALNAKADKSFSVTDVNRIGYQDGQETQAQHDTAIKKALLKSGGVGYAFNAYTVKPGEDGFVAGYYNPDTAALYTEPTNDETLTISATENINHVTLIVGYDDNYAKTNFNPAHRPQHNGAFLVRNSWGTAFGQAGYFWVSYEDFYIKASLAASSVNVGQPLAGHAQALRDTSARNSPFYVDYPNDIGLVDQPANANGDIVLGVKFPAKDHQLTLTSVSVDTDLANVNYEMYLVKDGFTETDNLADLKKQGTLIKKGFEASQGEHRRAIKPVQIPANQAYSLVVVERAQDKSLNNKGAQLFVTSAANLVSPKTAMFGYIDASDKLVWRDFYDVRTGTHRGSAVRTVVPYIFAYSAEK
ncbi:MAG: C1 family peptidase [Lactobacillaceae bacterium]|nr:C1 family peptidase [Lactobacillaceae bacterium]